MVSRPNHLRLVAAGREKISTRSPPTWGDLALLAVLLAVNLVPLVGLALRLGRWSAATLGLATACALVCGRELGIEARALLRRSWPRVEPRP